MGRDKATKEPIATTQLEEKRSPQILFLEICLQLVKPGGRMGIVLPESILGNPSYEYLVRFIQKHTCIRGVVTMPEALFKTSGKGGTHTKAASKNNMNIYAEGVWVESDACHLFLGDFLAFGVEGGIYLGLYSRS